MGSGIFKSKTRHPVLAWSRKSQQLAEMRIVTLLTVLFGGFFRADAFDPAQQDDSQALVRHFKKPSIPLGPPIKKGAFVPNPGETITLMGGADIYRMQEYPDFDILMHSAWKSKALRIRNIGWSADTVYRQQRPMFFYTGKGDPREGSVPDLREKIDPGTFILMFGKMESLDGDPQLPGFEASYESLITELKKSSQRIVLVAPIPFVGADETSFSFVGEIDSGRGLAEERNAVLTKYRECIQSLAAKMGVRYLDSGEYESNAYSGNGIHLSEIGQRQFAIRLATALGWKGQQLEGVESLVRKKNQLWYQYYRPTNWAFLFGDRQNVPSSRDNEDPERRWFVEEIEKIPPLIAKSERQIGKLTEGLVK